ncbi:hypothetical protein FEM48_Zijuj01G0090300 [Ziziphus jujuba var. spinosa]|uniref:Uncharacterized protein n=1 Tax=Ziziphus jujuba var. spinosa TaxID=714518 RepID=A0A978W0C3_ZIZJJ|nr:hypothetical protein FEM48_Zijuj01G0090300 [Ziziphus jujuba var. spinosa]
MSISWIMYGMVDYAQALGRMGAIYCHLLVIIINDIYIYIYFFFFFWGLFHRMIIWTALVFQKKLIGTDIEDFKCSWFVVKALELANEEQKKTLFENYGKPDPTNVAKGVYLDYEETVYRNLTATIEAQPSKAVQALLKSFLAKIYKRQKLIMNYQTRRRARRSWKM